MGGEEQVDQALVAGAFRGAVVGEGGQGLGEQGFELGCDGREGGGLGGGGVGGRGEWVRGEVGW